MYQNSGEGRKTKGKQEKEVLWPWKIERVELPLFVIFLSLGGGGETPVDGEYEPEKYGVPQVFNVDLDVLGLLTTAPSLLIFTVSHVFLYYKQCFFYTVSHVLFILNQSGK